MNPLSWSGPAFLAFYAALTLAVVVFCVIKVRVSSGKGAAPINKLTSDPYAIAYLRGSREEAIRVAIFNLVDRGILEYKDGKLRVAKGDGGEALRRSLDRGIVAQVKQGGSAASLVSDPKVVMHCEKYERELASN